MSVPVLRSAHVYPVKSLAARACDTVAVEAGGLAGGRPGLGGGQRGPGGPHRQD
ncbi:MOSC domain-containing protein, partial [Streptomyces anulatus]